MKSDEDIVGVLWWGIEQGTYIKSNSFFYVKIMEGLETSDTSEEQTNFARIVCLLFDLGPKVMQHILMTHLPGTVHARAILIITYVILAWKLTRFNAFSQCI